MLLEQTLNKLSELIKLSQFEEAEKISSQALKVFNDLRIKQFHGLAKIGLKKYQEGIKIFSENIEENNQSEDYNNLSLCYRFEKNYEMSYEIGKKGLVLNPNNASYYANLSASAKILGYDEEALELITLALSYAPETPSLWHDKGVFHFSIGDIKNAEICMENALKFKPVNENYYIQMFYILASQKKYPEAWKYYEFRYNTMPHVAKIIKRHNLELLIGKKDFYDEKICISFEQGYGDNLMYLRFLPEFQKIAPNSYLLLKDEVFNSFVEKLPIKFSNKIEENTDKITCIMSLPYLLQTTKIPKPLTTTQHQSAKNDKLKVGICWAGSALHPMDYQRSTYLRWYDELIRDESIQVYDLLKDKRPRIHKETSKIINFSEGIENYKMIDLSSSLTSVEQSINALNEIDVLVTVDTFLAHIAGTIGLKTYLLVSKLPDWRWGLTGFKNDWYESVEIHRQKTNFEDLIMDVYKKIREENSSLIFKD